MCEQSRAVLQVPADGQFLPACVAFVGRLGESLGMTPPEADRLRSATRETLENALKRAPAAAIEMSCEPFARALKVRLKDRGVPLDPHHPAEYAPAGTSISDFHPEGFGVYLLEHGVDEIHFRYLGREGNETVLVQYLRGGTPPPLPAPSQRPPLTGQASYDVRRMTADDAIGVCRCLYGAYGYSYPVEAVYNPDGLVELNRSGELLTVVAVAPDGEVFATASLEKGFGPKAMDMGVAATLPEYRGRGAAGRLLTFLLDEARREGLEGASAWTVTAHPFSQKMCLKAGFRECALMLANAPEDFQMESIEQHVRQRGSVFGVYLDLAGGEQAALYLPERHRMFLERLLRRHGLDPQTPVTTDGSAHPEGPTVLGVRANRLRAGAILELEKQGPDALDRVMETWQHLVATDFVELALFLDLGDPRTPELASRLEEHGFFPAGVLPRTRCGHALIMQYLHDIRLDYDSIVVASDEGRQLLDYVRSCDPNQRQVMPSR